MAHLGRRHLTSSTMTPFLYPFLLLPPKSCRTIPQKRNIRHNSNTSDTTVSLSLSSPPPPLPSPSSPETHLNPAPTSYTTTPFTDSCTLTITSGSGGHGCVSFVREKYIAFGPANGGDGGSGGNVYMRAERGPTSLHKLARRGTIKGGRGRNGRGGGRGGERGEDVIVSVPVGTVVREISRIDPVAEREASEKLAGGREPIEGDQRDKWRRSDWIMYPGEMPASYATAEFPALPRPRRSNLVAAQPSAPISLDLSTETEAPILLASGAMGGLGNPHFVTKSIPRPRFATRGEAGLSIQLTLELKLLADVGLVGYPNAGKSTLLRSLSRSQARVGDWAFTTLSPNIGTVVLDNHKGRPSILGRRGAANGKENRTAFSIADIPGVVEGAHLDRGLGLSFLRHVERARVLAFVIDLARGDAVEQIKALWREVGAYERLRARRDNEESEVRLVDWRPTIREVTQRPNASETAHLVDANKDIILPDLELEPISAKPWFVIANKADLPSTQGNFTSLQSYLEEVRTGQVAHPSGSKNAWRAGVVGVPVSAIRGEGVQRITEWIVGLLD